MYFFNRGDECQSWRLIGVAARSCIEMGLHRRQPLLQLFGNEAEYLSVTKLFWVVYALDRRWSFGMAMPFALQDADIDPSLPLPVSNYVRSRMISANMALSRTPPALICNSSRSTITFSQRSGITVFHPRLGLMLSAMTLASSTIKYYNGTSSFQKACDLTETT